jgi:dinuclear metal center YbgI/SA1388 family protein
MPIERDKIVKYCENYLKAKDFKDKCVNGLQVEGAPKVGKIITGVSLSKALIEAAVKKRAKMIIVHHGIFNSHLSDPPAFSGHFKERLKLLFTNNINLLGFHLPLDAHPVIGNNISILKLLGLKKVGTIETPEYGTIGFIGEFSQPVKFGNFVELVNEKINTKTYTIPAGPKQVKKVGIISGGASPGYEQAKAVGADTYICGDVREHLVRAIEEEKMNFINAGHYNTEVFGVRNLGELIAKNFDVKVEFIDIPCEI